MKHLLLFLFLISALLLPLVPVAAQQRPADATFLVDSLLSNVSRPPGGILYDRVLPLAQLDAFSIAPSAPDAVSSADHFKQGYLELYSAAYSPTGSGFLVSPTGLLAAIVAAQNIGYASSSTDPNYTTVPVGVLDYSFSSLDPDALQQGTLLNQNGLFFDGTGSPYLNRHAVIAAPTLKQSVSAVRFTLPASLLLTNTNRRVNSVTISGAALSTPVILQPNQYAGRELPVGEHILTYTVHFSDGTQSVARAKIEIISEIVRRPTVDDPYPVDLPSVLSEPWTDYEGIRAPGEAQVRLYLFNPQSKADGRVRRPVFVLDGFDPTDARPLQEVYDEFRGLAPLFSKPGEERDLVLLNFPNSERTVAINGVSSRRFIDGGADYIERNALAFTAVLNVIRNTYQQNPAEKSVVIGPSMGGLISRYALAQMERTYAAQSNPNSAEALYWKHNVDTWISVDSPNQGANVPLGDQLFLDYFQALSNSAIEARNRLLTPAARQLLLVQNVGPAANLQTRFMQALLSNGLPGSRGYPQQVRRVAMTNGAGDGQLQAALGQPSQQTLGMYVDFPLFSITIGRFFYKANTTIIKAQVSYGPSANGRATVFSVQTALVVAMFNNFFKVQPKNLTQYQYGDAQGCFDLAPGGTFDTQQQILDKTLASKPVLGTSYRFDMPIRPLHSFIATTSALDYNYRSLDNYTSLAQIPSPFVNLNGRALRCNDETPFDAYYISPTNTPHVSFNAAAASFIALELGGANQTPRFLGTQGEVVCLGAETLLRLDGCLRPGSTSTYSWTISGPGKFKSTNTAQASGPASNQTVISTGSGSIIVSVVESGNGRAASEPATFVFESARGASPLTIAVDYPGVFCPYTSPTVYANGLGVAPFTWTTQIRRNGVLTGSVRTYTTTDPSLSFLLRQDEVEVSVTATDPCSGARLPLGYASISPSDGYECNTYPYAISPVPGDDQIRVETLRSSEPAPSASVADEDNPHAYSVDVYNDWGRKVRSASTRKGQVALPTTDLPNGIYHVDINRDGKRTQQNVIIRH